MKKIICLLLSLTIIATSFMTVGAGGFFDEFLNPYTQEDAEEYVLPGLESILQFNYCDYIKDYYNAEDMITEIKLSRAAGLHHATTLDYYKDDFVSLPRVFTSDMNLGVISAYNSFDEILLSSEDKTNYYEIVLMDILTSDAYAKTFDENALLYADNILDGILEAGGNVADGEDFSNVPGKSGFLDELLGAGVGDAIDFGAMLADVTLSTAESFSEMANISMLEESKINVLKSIKAHTSNYYIEDACNDLIEKYKAASADCSMMYLIGLAEGTAPAREYIAETVVSAFFGGAGAIVSCAKVFNDVFLKTDVIVSNSMTLAAYVEIENILRNAINQAEREYINNPCYETADAYCSLADMYKATLVSGCEASIEYISAVPDKQIVRYVDPKNVGSVFVPGVPKSRTLKIAKDILTVVSEAKYYDFVSDVDGYISEVRSKTYSPWAATEVEQARKIGILPDEMCCNYQEPITRAEFCTLLTHLLTKKTGKSVEQLIKEKGELAKSPFADTEYKYVDYIYKLGIVNGTSETTFSPLSGITREQAATMLANAAKILGHDVSTKEMKNDIDASISAWALPGVNFVIENGIMSGTGNGFEPKGGYTKEQAILTMVRVYKKL